MKEGTDMVTPFATKVVEDTVSGTTARSPFAAVQGGVVENPATDRQLSFLRDLLTRKAAITGEISDESIETLLTGLSKSGASAKIDETKTWLDNNRHLKAAEPELEDGFYIHDDVPTPIRVIHAVHGSGHQYARALDPDTGKWDVQVPRLLAKLRDKGRRIDDDQDKAAEFGRLYGHCMVCGTVLTDKNPGGSIELGIGPYCRAKMGW